MKDYKDLLQHKYGIMRKAVDEYNETKQQVAYEICPHKVGDVVKMTCSPRFGEYQTGLVVAVEGTDSEPFWQLRVQPYKKDGTLSKVINIVTLDELI